MTHITYATKEEKKYRWLVEDSLDILIKFVTFLISPFISFMYSLRRINTKSSFWVFFLFAVIYGLCFTVIADDTDVFETNDAAKWRFRFENTGIYTFSDYVEFCLEYFQFAGTDIRDLYFATLTFVIHLFSDNYHVFFMAAALVFSYFQLKSFRFLVSSPAFDNSMLCLMICLLFCLNSIASISVLRFWTATWMCVYGIFQYLYAGKKKYLYFILLLPLIHRAFFFIYPILMFYLTSKYTNIWARIYFLSFFFSGVSTYVIQDATEYLPPFLTGMVDAYTETSIDERYSFTKLFLTSMSVIYVNILFTLILLKTKKEISEDLIPLFRFVLIFMTIVNLVISIPSLGVRFSIVSYSFVAFLWLNIMGVNSKYNILIYLMPLFMVRRLFLTANIFVKFQDFDFFYMNPFYLIYSHID